MALSDIPNPIPVIVEAKPEKVFDKQFCPELEILSYPANSGKPWTARFVGVPYDGNELSSEGKIQIELQDIKALAEKDPALAQALGAVLNVIGTYLVKCRLKNKRVVTVDNIEEILE